MSDLLELDFMKLRDKLSDIIKNDNRFYNIDRLNTPKSRKTFRKLFADFINDRNIYTHGSLVYRIIDNKVLIHFIDKTNKKYSYSEINIDIMKSYEDLFNYLKVILELLGIELGKLR